MSLFGGVARLLSVAVVSALPAWVILWIVVGWGDTWTEIARWTTIASAVVIGAYVQVLKRNDTLYRREIAAGLERAYEAAAERERDFDVGAEKLVVFSDQHKGTRDGADDFWRAERAYCSALAYYLETQHHLVVLGDAEELWETSWPSKVIKRHTQAHRGPDEDDGERALDFEARFQRQGRYERVWGNHDLNWARPSQVEKHLVRCGPFAEGLEVREGIRLRVVHGGKPLGRLFLVHGHQGTADSQVITPISRPVVRAFGFLQRRFKKGWNTPSNDLKLRERHDRAMFQWAKSKLGESVVLIAGHTHRPVFWDRKRKVPTSDEIEAQTARLEDAERTESDTERAERAADLAFAHADRRWGEGSGGPPPEEITPPVYFNTGCCSFVDGDATGIEIDDGLMRLVRWPDNQGDPRPQRLERASAPLEEVFAALDGYVPGGGA